MGIKPATSTSLQHIASYNSFMGEKISSLLPFHGKLFMIALDKSFYSIRKNVCHNDSGIKNCFDAFNESQHVLGFLRGVFGKKNNGLDMGRDMKNI